MIVTIELIKKFVKMVYVCIISIYIIYLNITYSLIVFIY
jgi:hypothetical protein